MYYDDICFYLSKLQCIIASSNTPYVFILGDFNVDIQSTSIFGAELIDFCDNNELCFVDSERLLPDTFTYTSQTSARPEVRGTADVGWRSLNPLPINPSRTHSRLYHHMFLRTDGR